MKKMVNKFLEETTNELDKMYNEDEFRDGYAEAIELFKNSVLRFFENIKPELDCKVLEFDAEYDDDTLNIIECIGTELKGRTIIDYYTTIWNDSYFFILLLKKRTTK